MTPQKKRAIIYARISRDDSGEGRSPARQIESCRHLALARDWEVVDVKQDISMSAYSEKRRPAWSECLEMIEAGQVDVLVSWHIDRMLRSMSELENLIVLAEKHDVGVSTVSGDIDLTSDTGRMIARILAAVSRAEVERKSARQKLSNSQRAREGRSSFGGTRPFGYERDMVTVVPEEADAIRSAASQVIQGVPLRSIVRQFTAAGLMSSRSKPGRPGWSPRGVRFMLLNPRYAGIRIYLGDEVAKGDWEPILDRETHLLLRRVLEDSVRTQGASKLGRMPTSLLSGIATCSVCGQQVRGSSAKMRGSTDKRLTYTCRPGGHVTPSRADADALVASRLVVMLTDPDALRTLLPTGNANIDEARAEYDVLRHRTNELAGLFAEGLITADGFREASGTLQRKLHDALARMDEGPLIIGLDIGTEQVAEQWEALPLGRKRALVAKFFDVTIHPNGHTRRVVPITDIVTISQR